MMSTEIIIAIIAAFGGGGIGAAIVSGLFNRKKLAAEADLSTITSLKGAIEAQDARLNTLSDSLDRVMVREEKLNGDVDILKNKLRGRDLEIGKLTKENKDLKQRVDELVAENLSKDREIADLTARVEELRRRLDALNGYGGDGT